MVEEETLRDILLFFMWVAAISTTVFPILYALSPWTSTTIGRTLMFSAVSLALAIDLTLLGQYGIPSHVHFRLWIYIIVFASIAISSGILTWLLWKSNRHSITLHKHKEKQ